MYIKYENANVQRHHNSEYMPDGYVVTPSENGIGQVTQEVGEALVANYDTIEVHNE